MRWNFSLRNLFAYPKVLVSIAVLATASFLLYYGYSKVAMNAKTKSMLKMSYWEFDQSDKGWRSLSDPDAAKLLDQYLQTAEVSVSDKANLYFHAGQVYASLSDYKTALARFRLSKQLSNYGWEAGWNAYVDATIAFLEGDSHALQIAKTTLEGQKDVGIDVVDSTEKLYPHRINLRVVENLVKGLRFKKMYYEVYGSD